MPAAIALFCAVALGACSTGSGGIGIPTEAQSAATVAIGAIDPCQVMSVTTLDSVYNGMDFTTVRPLVVTSDGGRACTFKGEQGVTVVVTIYPDLDGQRYQQAAARVAYSLPNMGQAIMDTSGQIIVRKGPATVMVMPTTVDGQPLPKTAAERLAQDVIGGLARG
jgi:hypothetical protein